MLPGQGPAEGKGIVGMEDGERCRGSGGERERGSPPGRWPCGALMAGRRSAGRVKSTRLPPKAGDDPLPASGVVRTQAGTGGSR